MIVGPEGWNDKYNYIIQTNNPTESFLEKMRLTVPGVHPLQSCGPSAAAICSSILVGYDNIVPKIRGKYKPQPEEVLMDFFQDEKYLKEFLQIRSNFNWKKTHFNEVPQYYPFSVKMVFGVNAEFTWHAKLSYVVSYLKNDYPVQICLKNPGHYIAIVAYDTINEEFHYHDPWPERFKDGKDGFNRIMTKAEFKNNVKPFAIVYKSDALN